jgi:hypothetical protein
MENESITIEQKETIKLIKMTKGYNWEIKLIMKPDTSDAFDLERLSNINKKLKEEYGGVTE